MFITLTPISGTGVDLQTALSLDIIISEKIFTPIFGCFELSFENAPSVVLDSVLSIQCLNP